MLAIAGISTVVVLGELTALILTSPGWSAVKRTFFLASAFSLARPTLS